MATVAPGALRGRLPSAAANHCCSPFLRAPIRAGGARSVQVVQASSRVDVGGWGVEFGHLAIRLPSLCAPLLSLSCRRGGRWRAIARPPLCAEVGYCDDGFRGYAAKISHHGANPIVRDHQHQGFGRSAANTRRGNQGPSTRPWAPPPPTLALALCSCLPWWRDDLAEDADRRRGCDGGDPRRRLRPLAHGLPRRVPELRHGDAAVEDERRLARRRRRGRAARAAGDDRLGDGSVCALLQNM